MQAGQPKLLVQVKNLSKKYRGESGLFNSDKTAPYALHNLSFDIFEGETLGIVGESGSGKTTLGKCLIRLLESDSGSIYYRGKDILKLQHRKFREIAPGFQLVFQNAGQALNPRKTVFGSIAEVAKIRQKSKSTDLQKTVINLLKKVSLLPEFMWRYPSQLSGGQRQRVLIARALAAKPQMLIADEVTSSLDASLKLKIIDLLNRLKSQFNLTLVLISHDIRMISKVSDRIAVMKNGIMVEIGRAVDLLENPAHPYTNDLLRSSRQSPVNLFSFGLEERPSLTVQQRRSGCPYLNECPLALKTCSTTRPVPQKFSDGRSVACFNPVPHQQPGADVKSSVNI